MTKIDLISIQTLCHATESEEKVLEAVERLYPTFERKSVKGHFGNPIVLFEAHIKRKKDITPVLELFKEKLASQVTQDLHRRVDRKGNLYIRLDKQELYRGKYVLKDSGEVKIVIHIQFYPTEGKDAVYYAENLFCH